MTVTIEKGGETWVFRFAPANVERLLSRLAEMAADPASDFDWFDAAEVSWEAGKVVKSA